MGRKFTLSDIRDAAARKYAPVEVQLDDEGEEILYLIPALRLPKEKREALAKIQEERAAKEEGDATTLDQLADFLRDYIRIIGSDAKLTEKLLAVIGDDVAEMSEFVAVYNEDTEVGEASTSEN